MWECFSLFWSTAHLKQISTKFQDACHKNVRMFCANHDITTQEYMVKAAMLYFKTYLNEVDKQYMTCGNDIDTDPSAPFDYPLQ